MAEHWISASKTYELASRDRYALCERLNAGLINARAEVLMIDDNKHESKLLPQQFWWARGYDALEQNWSQGDFSTQIQRKGHWRAFGVQFGLTGILELLPVEQRGQVARSLSIAGSTDWITAKQARQFAYTEGHYAVGIAGAKIVELARLGFMQARAVLAQGTLRSERDDDWSWERREWDIPAWYWEGFTAPNSSLQEWELGKFSGSGVGPDGYQSITLSAVHFSKDSLDAIKPGTTASQPAAKNTGGRPPLAFSDDMMAAICGMIYRGELVAATQADIEKAMLDWASAKNFDLSETTARGKARRIFDALKG